MNKTAFGSAFLGSVMLLGTALPHEERKHAEIHNETHADAYRALVTVTAVATSSAALVLGDIFSIATTS